VTSPPEKSSEERAQPPVVEEKVVKPSGRRKAQLDDQMNLFGAEPVRELKPATNGNLPTVDENETLKGEAAAVEPASATAEPGIGAAERKKAEPKKIKEPRTATPKKEPEPPPVDPAELREAVRQIVPLLADQDPGAGDCLKDNLATFRGGFSHEGFSDFSQAVRDERFADALEQLRKAAKKNGIAV